MLVPKEMARGKGERLFLKKWQGGKIRYYAETNYTRERKVVPNVASLAHLSLPPIPFFMTCMVLCVVIKHGCMMVFW